MLHLQQFLRNGGTLDDLLNAYAIKSNRHKAYPNLVQFKYNQIDSPFSEKIVCECRGIILDESNNWNVVARAFDKFFNDGEGHGEKLDWNTARIQEKLDGSLIIMYHYDGKWNVATSGTADAGGQVYGFAFTFAQLFWRVWEENGYCSLDALNKRNTYMFELMTPYNRIVVQHKENKLALIGIRNNETGIEQDANEISIDGFPPVVKSFALNTYEDVIASLGSIDPMSQEGYVAVDKAFNRRKIKSPQYVAIHHMRDGMSPRKMLEIVRGGEKSEFLTYFPEWTGIYNDVSGKWEALIADLEGLWNANSGITDQKSFAMKVKHHPFAGAVFAQYHKYGMSIRQFMKDVNIRKVMDYLKLKEVEM